MTDLCDRVQIHTGATTNAALKKHFKNLKPEPPQHVIAGRVLCIDCDEPISPARLAAKPNAARCTLCQSVYEGLHDE